MTLQEFCLDITRLDRVIATKGLKGLAKELTRPADPEDYLDFVQRCLAYADRLEEEGLEGGWLWRLRATWTEKLVPAVLTVAEELGTHRVQLPDYRGDMSDSWVSKLRSKYTTVHFSPQFYLPTFNKYRYRVSWHNSFRHHLHTNNLQFKGYLTRRIGNALVSHLNVLAIKEQMIKDGKLQPAKQGPEEEEEAQREGQEAPSP